MKLLFDENLSPKLPHLQATLNSGSSKWHRSRAVKIFTLVAVHAVSGCTHDEALSDQPTQAAAQIRAWIPVGTSQTDAQRIIEQHRFTSSLKTNCSFGNLKAADFLYCDYSTGWPVSRRWQVALVVSGGKISDVQVATGLSGP